MSGAGWVTWWVGGGGVGFCVSCKCWVGFEAFVKWSFFVCFGWAWRCFKVFLESVITCIGSFCEGFIWFLIISRFWMCFVCFCWVERIKFCSCFGCCVSRVRLVVWFVVMFWEFFVVTMLIFWLGLGMKLMLCIESVISSWIFCFSEVESWYGCSWRIFLIFLVLLLSDILLVFDICFFLLWIFKWVFKLFKRVNCKLYLG